MCQPVALVSGLAVVQHIVLDSEYVYFTSQGSAETLGQVVRIAKPGGLPEVLATDQENPYGLAVDGNYVYWANMGTTGVGSVMKVAKSGVSLPEEVAGNQSSNGHGARVVAVDDTNIYWGNYFEVWTCPLTGCDPSPTQLCAAGGVEGIAASGGIVYFTEGDGMQVSMVASFGGVPGVLAGDQARPVGLALDDTHAYWTNSGGDAGTKAISRAPLGGGSTTVLATTDDPVGVAVDEVNVYWADRNVQQIRRAPKAGGGPVSIVATGQVDDCRWLAVDAEAVYWTCYWGVVRKLAK